MKKKDLESVYPCPLLTFFGPQFILMLSSHQLSFPVLQLHIPWHCSFTKGETDQRTSFV